MARLLESKAPDEESVRRLRVEVATRDPAEYEAAEIESLTERYRRHTVMESPEILQLELQYCERHLARPEVQADAYARRLGAAKLAVVQDVMNRRSQTSGDGTSP